MFTSFAEVPFIESCRSRSARFRISAEVPCIGMFTPYLLAGLGILRASASTTVFGVNTSVSDTEAGLNIGGGARWQGGANWGVRPEVKVFVAENSSVRFSVRLYYQFGS